MRRRVFAERSRTFLRSACPMMPSRGERHHTHTQQSACLGIKYDPIHLGCDHDRTSPFSPIAVGLRVPFAGAPQDGVQIPPAKLRRLCRDAAGAVRTLSRATAAFASRNPATVYTLAGIG